MALNAYMTMETESGETIEGSSNQAGRENMMEVFDIKHGIIAPLDSGSGRPSGGRQHKPLTVTKALDKGSPLLQRLLHGSDRIAEVRIMLYRPSSSGAEVHYYSITLTNPTIVSIQLDMANNRYDGAVQLPVMERVSFTYESITSTFEDGGISSENDWESGS